jgi:hypothetical protein
LTPSWRSPLSSLPRTRSWPPSRSSRWDTSLSLILQGAAYSLNKSILPRLNSSLTSSILSYLGSDCFECRPIRFVNSWSTAQHMQQQNAMLLLYLNVVYICS